MCLKQARATLISMSYIPSAQNVSEPLLSQNRVASILIRQGATIVISLFMKLVKNQNNDTIKSVIYSCIREPISESTALIPNYIALYTFHKHPFNTVNHAALIIYILMGYSNRPPCSLHFSLPLALFEVNNFLLYE